MDTTHFRGNTPDSIKIEGAYLKDDQDLKSANWIKILNRTKVYIQCQILKNIE